MRCAIIHYHELALKGRNRDFFERQLLGNIRSALKGLGATRIESLRGRLRVVLPDHLSDHTVKERLSAVFGIANFSLARGVPLNLHSPDLEELTRGIGAAVTQRAFDTFRVSAKRADKRLTLTSMDVERAVGKYLCDLTGKTVKLTAPDLTIYIELLAKDAYYYLEKIQGPGGMPVGVSGTVACLISGGIDSPVAAYRMMKRGCNAVFVHFSGRPLVSRASEDKVRDLVQILTAHQYHSKLFIVPFGEIQREIVAEAPSAYRVVLYRRLMVRIAGELALARGLLGPRDRRQPRPGGLTNAGKSIGHRRGSGIAASPPAHRHGQARDYRPGAAYRHLHDVNRAGSGLLFTLRSAAPQHQDPHRRHSKNRTKPRHWRARQTGPRQSRSL